MAKKRNPNGNSENRSKATCFIAKGVINGQYYIVSKTRAGRTRLVRGPISENQIPNTLTPEIAKKLLKDDGIPIVKTKSQLVTVGFEEPIVSVQL